MRQVVRSCLSKSFPAETVSDIPSLLQGHVRLARVLLLVWLITHSVSQRSGCKYHPACCLEATFTAKS